MGAAIAEPQVGSAGERRSLFRDIVTVPDVRVTKAWRLWQRNAAIYRRTYKMNILPNFFEPFFYLLAMGVGLGRYLAGFRGVRYLDYIAPGLAASAAMFGTTFEVTINSFVKMQFGKVYDAITATPLTTEDIGAGELLWGTTRSLIYGLVFLAIAAGFGVVHSWMVVFAPVAVAMIGLMFSVIGLIFTASVPIIDLFSYYFTLFITPMFLFSGIFFPLDQLPHWVRAVAWFIPLHHAVNLMRALILYGNAAAAGRAALWIAGLTAALVVVPLNLLRRRLVK
jgi:lipooligosaccharide transport system permease protein